MNRGALIKQLSRIGRVAFCLVLTWLAMLLAYQTPYRHTVVVNQAVGKEAFNFQAITGLGQVGYLWSDRFAYFAVDSPGSPLRLSIRLGGRVDSTTVTLSLNNKPLGVITLPYDGSIISQTFSPPMALFSRDDLRVGLLAPALKRGGRNLGVQVDQLTVENAPGLGWPPLTILIATSLVGILLAAISWRLQGRWLYAVLTASLLTTYLLLQGRAGRLTPMLFYAVMLALVLAALLWQANRPRSSQRVGWLRPTSLKDFAVWLGAGLWWRLNNLLLINRKESKPFLRAAVVFVILIQMDLFIGTPGQGNEWIPFFYFTGLVLVFVAAVLRGAVVNLVLIGGVVTAGIVVRWFWANQPETGDVYLATTQACDFFLHGRNPYAEVFTAVWYQPPPGYIWYGYLPMTLFSELPFYLLGDIRWGLATYDLLTIGLIYLLARRYWGADIGAALAILPLLFVPLTRFTIQGAVVDPVMLFWIVLSIYLLDRQHWLLAATAAGLALASKQYAIVYILILLIYFIRQRRWRELVVMLTIPTLIILPYFLWSPTDFINDTVKIHLSWLPQPEPFPGQWNTSIWAQLMGIRGDNGTITLTLKPWASVIMAAMVGAVMVVNAWRPGLKQVVSTTTVLLITLFALNSGLTQYTYWRDVVIMALVWAAVWKMDDAAHLASVAPELVSSEVPHEG